MHICVCNSCILSVSVYDVCVGVCIVRGYPPREEGRSALVSSGEQGRRDRLLLGTKRVSPTAPGLAPAPADATTALPSMVALDRRSVHTNYYYNVVLYVRAMRFSVCLSVCLPL